MTSAPTLRHQRPRGRFSWARIELFTSALAFCACSGEQVAPRSDAITPSLATPLPSWAEGLIGVLFIVGAVLLCHGCWWLVESPTVRHWLHRFDPLCSRCWRARQRRDQQRRTEQLIRETREREARRHG